MNNLSVVKVTTTKHDSNEPPISRFSISVNALEGIYNSYSMSQSFEAVGSVVGVTNIAQNNEIVVAYTMQY